MLCQDKTGNGGIYVQVYSKTYRSDVLCALFHHDDLLCADQASSPAHHRRIWPGYESGVDEKGSLGIQ